MVLGSSVPPNSLRYIVVRHRLVDAPLDFEDYSQRVLGARVERGADTPEPCHRPGELLGILLADGDCPHGLALMASASCC